MNDTASSPRPLRHAGLCLLAGLSLLLSGCFISPGKFNSSLELTEDQGFSFTYEGEIFFLVLSDKGPGNDLTVSETFEPSPCFVDASSEVRDCTANELEGQRAAWERQREQDEARAKREAEQAAAIMGGINPSDPEAADRLVKLLMRQKGWERVVNKGNGLFDVSYTTQGKLTHDFIFPVIEGFPTTNPFVQIHVREGDVVRINAPGYGSMSDNMMMPALFGGMGALGGLSQLGDEENADPDAPKPPIAPEGTFTIRTTERMEIRANNTDEGAVEIPGGRELSWEVNAGSKDTPTALIAIGS